MNVVHDGHECNLLFKYFELRVSESIFCKNQSLIYHHTPWNISTHALLYMGIHYCYMEALAPHFHMNVSLCHHVPGYALCFGEFYCLLKPFIARNIYIFMQNFHIVLLELPHLDQFPISKFSHSVFSAMYLHECILTNYTL